MKILFLDIDGVLNSRETILENHEKRKTGKLDVPISACNCGSDTCWPHHTLVGRLNEIISKTGAMVVMSSSWRIGKMVVELRELCRAFGMNGTLLDKTPVLHKPRGLEIQEWIDNATDEVDSFAILDDDSDMEHLFSFLVQTDYRYGLQDGHVKEVCEMLNKGE
jgi:hypothetical protein